MNTQMENGKQPANGKIKIVATHIEHDTVNNALTVVYTDENSEEWVHEEQTSNHGGYITKLVKKPDSWYFKPKTF